MKYSKLENESINEYCHRMFMTVKQEENLSWKQLAEIMNEELGLNYSDWWYRQREKVCLSSDDDNEDNNALLELMKAKVKLSDERVQVNALVRKLSREETIKEIALNAASLMSEKKILKNIPTTCAGVPSKNREGLLLIGDWHYGIEINNIFNVYDRDICVQRVQMLRDNIIEHCLDNQVFKLKIANLGDMIAGNIHLPLRINSRIDVLTQIMEVSELLAEFLNDLSQYFVIDYYSVDDNHSRIEPNKNDSIDLESLCRITEWYLRQRLKDNKNITFNDNVYGDSIATANIHNYNIAFVHGHKDNQSTIIDKLNNFTKQHFDLICSAHMHHFSSDESYNTFMIANGSLMGTDDYAFNKRLNSDPSQTLIIVSDNNVTEAIYRMVLK